jgi:hypothetical protein
MCRCLTATKETRRLMATPARKRSLAVALALTALAACLLTLAGWRYGP